MNLNKLVTETRCEVEERDYEGSMDACMELFWESGLRTLDYYEDDEYWRASCSSLYGIGKTPQLAIIKAFLKSKGVTLEESE